MNIIKHLTRFLKSFRQIHYTKFMPRKDDKMKKATDIIKYGTIKKYGIKRKYLFNSIDIETVDNEIFLLGYHLNDEYHYTLNNFFEVINEILIKSVQN